MAKPKAILKYTEIWKKVWECDTEEDRETVKKLLLDEVGAREAWRVIECLNRFKGFKECFWIRGGGMPEEHRDVIFNELANLFRDEPYNPEWAEE